VSLGILSGMVDKYSTSPRELQETQWNYTTMAIQVQQGLWSAIISFNGIIIAIFTIVPMLNKAVNFWDVYIGISFSIISVILLIFNYRVILFASLMTYNRFNSQKITEDGHIQEHEDEDEVGERMEVFAKRIKMRENISIILSASSVFIIFIILH
jgi:hypothetical protein